MSIIQHRVLLSDSESQISINGASRYTAYASSFTAYTVPQLSTTPTAVDLGNVITPRFVSLRLLSGDDVLVSIGGVDYPMRITMQGAGRGESILLRLDTEGLKQVDEVTVPADVNGSLAGEYFITGDRFSDEVWVCFTTDDGFKASGTITYGAPVDTDTVEVDGTTFTKVSSTPGANEFSTIGELTALIQALADVNATDNGTTITIRAAVFGTSGNSITLAVGVGNTGTMAVSGSALAGGTDTSQMPAPDNSRLIEVRIAENSSATAVATATAAALSNDAEFIATSSGAVVTITDRHTGTRAGATDNGVSGLSVASPNPQDGANSPEVWFKSTGTSSLLVAVAPD